MTCRFKHCVSIQELRPHSIVSITMLKWVIELVAATVQQTNRGDLISVSHQAEATNSWNDALRKLKHSFPTAKIEL